MTKYYSPWPNSPSSTGEPRGIHDNFPLPDDHYMPPLYGAKNIELSKKEAEEMLTHIHKAKEIIQKHDLPEETILINHLNSIGAILLNK